MTNHGSRGAAGLRTCRAGGWRDKPARHERRSLLEACPATAVKLRQAGRRYNKKAPREQGPLPG